ncbi:MAG TPA: hypothetical protein PK939_04005 [Bacteroidales bacterium]|nr:hypothetical protein [Bacteroidales bacterium]HQQ11824.1 hypothetical protein [Bacteroidales bacterium]
MNISSNWKEIKGNTNQVYDFASDLTNMGGLMPEQVVNWQAEKDKCSFTVKGMTSLSLRIEEQIPGKRLRLVPDGKSPFDFELLLHLREKTTASCEAMVEVSAELNPMLAMMAKRPLQNLVDIIVEKLSQKTF